MDEFVLRLSRLDSCAVSDALDKLGLKGAVTGIHRFSSEKKIAGRVLTVKLDRAEGRSNTRHLCTAAIEAASPGDIIVVEQHTGIDAASWGGNLSIGAQMQGVAGVIVDGPVRDIDDSRKLDFPVFARDHTARTARGRIVEVATGEPIDVGGVTVSPGDYAVADGSAAVFVAQSDIERVLEAAEAIVAREEAMAQALREGKPISQVMGANYEHMLKGGTGPERPSPGAETSAGPAATGSVVPPKQQSGTGPQRPSLGAETSGGPAATGSVAPPFPKEAT
jgi:regulator of RNase E activity RraA